MPQQSQCNNVTRFTKVTLVSPSSSSLKVFFFMRPSNLVPLFAFAIVVGSALRNDVVEPFPALLLSVVIDHNFNDMINTSNSRSNALDN